MSVSLLYRGLLRLSVPLVPILMSDPRQRAAHLERLHSPTALEEWAATRDRSRPLVWFHAASVGEGLQAEAVIHSFRARHPEALILYTRFSPSADALATRIAADFSAWLPYDRETDANRVLTALQPDLLVFVKLDLWPELASQAAGLGIPVALAAATVDPGSSRLSPMARWLLRPGYQAVRSAGAITSADGRRLQLLGVASENIVITDDPRIDSALYRAHRVEIPRLELGEGPLPLIGGSTWQPDEEVLLAAFARVQRQLPARLILVPHDPDPARLRSIDERITSLGLAPAQRLSRHDPEQPLPPLLVVDRTGLLAGLYRLGLAGYVGGGFGNRGIHSTLEPAAAGLPVITGPFDRGARDVHLLREAGVLVQLAVDKNASGSTWLGRRSAPTGHALGRAVSRLVDEWLRWLTDPQSARREGALAQSLLRQHSGASERSASLLSELLAIRGYRPAPDQG